jgi:hypothetical protein
MTELGTPKQKNVLDKAYRLFGTNCGRGLSFDPLSKLIDYDKQVGEAPGRFFEGSQEVQAPYGKGPCDGDGLEHLGRCVDLSRKVLTSFARPNNLNCVGSDRWLVKTFLESFTDHAPL